MHCFTNTILAAALLTIASAIDFLEKRDHENLASDGIDLEMLMKRQAELAAAEAVKSLRSTMQDIALSAAKQALAESKEEIALSAAKQALAESTQASAESRCALPENATWCQVTAGNSSFTMAVYAENDWVSRKICENGFWEVANAADFGSPGLALDIGANVGYYTLLMANAGWRVKAFEPLPSNLQLIRASLCRNPDFASRVSLYPVGLGPKEDHCKVVSDAKNVGDGWVACGGRIVPQEYVVRGEFDIRPLDDVLSGQEQIDFVKLDVEGFECNVFQGATQLLKESPPKTIQTEVWPDNHMNNGMSGCKANEYLQMLTQAGYTVSKTRDCSIPDTKEPDYIAEFFACRDMPSDSATLLELQDYTPHSHQQVVFHRA